MRAAQPSVSARRLRVGRTTSRQRAGRRVDAVLTTAADCTTVKCVPGLGCEARRQQDDRRRLCCVQPAIQRGGWRSNVQPEWGTRSSLASPAAIGARRAVSRPMQRCTPGVAAPRRPRASPGRRRVVTAVRARGRQVHDGHVGDRRLLPSRHRPRPAVLSRGAAWPALVWFGLCFRVRCRVVIRGRGSVQTECDLQRQLRA